MSEFELFEKALEKFENISIHDNHEQNICQKCKHKDIINENGIISCLGPHNTTPSHKFSMHLQAT